MKLAPDSTASPTPNSDCTCKLSPQSDSSSRNSASLPTLLLASTSFTILAPADPSDCRTNPETPRPCHRLRCGGFKELHALGRHRCVIAGKVVAVQEVADPPARLNATHCAFRSQ